MIDKVKASLTEDITMPRWVAWGRLVWGLFISVCALFVLILWYQSATRDEESDRNLRAQACASAYAATYDAHAGLFLQAVADAAAQENPDLQVLFDEGAATAEMAARRLGVAFLISELDNDFECPSIPIRLKVEPVNPLDPDPAFVMTNAWDAVITLIVSIPTLATLYLVYRQRAPLRSIDAAVNGRAPGQSTMSQDIAVSRLRDEATDAE